MAEQHIIDKVLKLLSLAENNNNAAEATAAALKAQQLIAQHDISQNELHYGIEEKIGKVVSDSIKGMPWAKYLAEVIADNFRCGHWYRTSSYKNSWSGRRNTTNEYIIFIGYDTDANAAAVTFNRLVKIGNRLAAAACRRDREAYGTARGTKNSFLMGYVSGIRCELEKQSMALMLVRPKAVNDYLDEAQRDMQKGKRAKIRNNIDPWAYNEGKDAGRDSLRSARLGQASLPA